MRLSLLAPLLALASAVFAEEPVANAADAVVDGVAEDVEIVTDPNFVPTPEKPFNFRIDYNVAFKEDPNGNIEDFVNGETVELLFEFHSLEPAPVTIVGVGGQLLDPVTGEVKANITASQLGPIEVANNQNENFTQRVGINMEAADYLLVPAIYVVYQDQFMMLGSKNKIVTVVEPSISIFNPQLIMSELILLVSFAGIVYALFNVFGAQYLNGILPESLLPKDKKKKAKKAKKDSPVEASATSVESWLPEQHKKLTKKGKKKL